MPGIKAVILIRLDGVPRNKQEAFCLKYCERHRYTAIALCFHVQDAMNLVASGAAKVVVTAYPDDQDGDLDFRIMAVGGRLEYIRKPRKARRRFDIGQLVAGMFRRGADVPTIGHMLDIPTGEVRVALREQGIQANGTPSGQRRSHRRPESQE